MANISQVSPGVRLGEMGTPTFNGIVIADGGLLYESAVSGITATASGTSANSYKVVNELTRVNTVATSGDGVVLPASGPGLTIILENASALPMQVFASGTDQINGNAGTVGVSQMASSVVIYTSYAAGAWFANGLGTGYSGSLQTQSVMTSVTARAGGGQALATPLVTMMTNVTVCATSGDSVLLPPSAAGLQIAVANNGAASMNVFPPSGSTMNGVLNASVAVSTGVVLLLFCVAANVWISK